MENKKKFVILIVDDNIQNLQLAGDTLKEVGYTTALANNANLALDFLKRKEADLILLDILMPEINGFELCKRLKSQDSTKHIPIIFLTAKTEIDDMVKGFEYGAVDYVTKPFNTKELVTRVSTHLELKLTKDQLVQKVEELNIANQTKDKFFSIIAHDLSNLFGSFINLMAMWDYYKTGGTPENVFVNTLNSIQSSAKTGYDLLVNLLNWSRAQTGRLDIKPIKLNLKQLVENNLKLLESNANEKNMNISLNIPDDIMIYVDKNMFNTIIRNLLSNAIKFTPNGGKIEINSQAREEYTEIVIIDTGVGIEKENIPKLFRIDQKLKTKGTNKERGTGLGLVLCKEFIDKNNGEIWVESVPNEGSRFFLRFPN